ncbi:hypothetical protein ElyMa_004272200 [Elysia marginata]|uniref:MATH domain-containing protein n=1 Tax=Elysia marginata TaxID=1093978 RepID=A0AAV4GUZ9_9GAST|nr:hypothetical protein ElyMa_004272200 [Elysia marginata]
MNVTTARVAEIPATENRVREIVDEAVSPLKTAIEEMKLTVARELEEERRLLANLWADTQSGIMAELKALRADMKHQLDIRRSPPRLPNSDQPSYEAASDAGTQGNKLAADITAELEWFREQVLVLQEGQRQYRQELNSREHQRVLQERVSVSLSELQEQLRQTKDGILSSVNALCSYMEAEINTSSRMLHEDTKRSVREMLCEIDTGVVETASSVQHPIDSLPEEDHVRENRDTMGENVAEQRDPVHRETAKPDANTLEGILEKLQALTVGQSQRVIDKIRNPSHENDYVFHLYIPQFEEYIGSGKRVYSLPCAIDFMYMFMVVRGVASFSEDTNSMSLGLARMVNVHELGLERGKTSSFVVNCKIKAPNDSATSDVEVSTVRLRWEDEPVADTESTFETLGEPIECRETLVNEGFNNFKNGSLVVEFKLSLTSEQSSLLSYFRKS